MQQEILIAIVGSAGIASIVSGIFLLINENLRRRSEQKQLKMEIALKLVKLKDEQVGEAKKNAPQGTKIIWIDPSDNLKEYLKRISKIWKEI